MLFLVGELATLTNGIVQNGFNQVIEAERKDWFVLLTRLQVPECGECEKVQCGGALVAQDMVLTAAHCFDTDNPADTAWVGRQSMCSINGDIGKAFGLATVYFSPRYNSEDENNFHDWALVKLVELGSSTCDGGTLGDNTAFLTYGERNTTVSDLLDFYGFGRSAGASRTAPVLMHTWSTRADQDECETFYGSIGFDRSYQICIRPRITCFGDSGGPRVLGDDVVGIASYLLDAHFDNPEISCLSIGEAYTKVQIYKDEIFASICTHSASPPTSCQTATIRDEDIGIGRDLPMTSTLKRMMWMALRKAATARVGSYFWGDWFSWPHHEF